MMKVSMGAIMRGIIHQGHTIKDGGNRIPRSTHPTREGERIADQKRHTIEEVGEHSDVETKKQNLPSILGPGPTELRFQQPIDNQQDLNDCRQNERILD